MTNILNITHEDLKLAYEGELDDDRTEQYQYRIDEAVRMLKSNGQLRGWNLLPAIASGHIDLELAKDIVLRAVGRVLRNEEGLDSESENGYAYKINQNVASGELRIFPSELDQLFPVVTRPKRQAYSHQVNFGGWGPS